MDSRRHTWTRGPPNYGGPLLSVTQWRKVESMPYVFADERAESIPCVLCRRDTTVGNLEYRTYDGRQVFVCDSCDDDVNDALLAGDSTPWDLALARSGDAADLLRNVQTVSGTDGPS